MLTCILRRMNSIKLPLRIALALAGVTIILLTLHLAFQHLNLAYNEKHGQIFEISNRFDVDDEASLPTWFSQAIWLCVAGASIVAAKLASQKSVRKLWLSMALIGVLFSIDEVSGIHELSLQSLHLLFFGLERSSSTLNAWWLVMPVVLVFGVWFMSKLLKVLHKRQWLIMMFGWLIFLIGAVGLELHGNDIPHNTFMYQGIVTGIEEGLEMLGGIIILYVVLNHLNVHNSRKIKAAWQELGAKK